MPVWEAHLKRGFDIAASVIALALLSPVLVIIALAVVLDSGRPVFYSQARVGVRFKTFQIWKFRSMRTDQSGPTLTAGGDRRVTRVGLVIRRVKLDELPQFWNVIKGDMSFVGPRPEVPEFVELYRDRYRPILEVRPGLTDLATINFCGEETLLAGVKDPLRAYVEEVLPRKLSLSEIYLSKRSFAFDLWILARTVGAVLGIPRQNNWTRVGVEEK